MAHKVRTTFNPSEVLTVDDAEYTDLERQGLLVDEKKAARLDAADEKKEG